MNKQSTIIVALTGLFLLSACQSKKQQHKQEALKVEVMTAEPTNGFSNQQYVGQVEEESSTSVSFAAMGTLKQVLVTEGQHVNVGQIVAVLDPESAQSTLAFAKAQLAQAKDALGRMKQLHETNSLPDMKWIEVQSKVEQAQAQYNLAMKQVSDCNLKAPCSGIVGQGVKNTGEVVVPSSPVLSILNINKVKVNVSIPEKELSTLRPGTLADITCDALPGEYFHSTSFVKGIQADVMTHTYEVSFWVNNTLGRLLPGMVCNVYLSSSKSQAGALVIAVPVRCVQQNADGKQFVWVVRDGKAHRQNVTLGVTVGNNIAITSGLIQGEKVIIQGYQKVSEGSAVKPQVISY